MIRWWCSFKFGRLDVGFIIIGIACYVGGFNLNFLGDADLPSGMFVIKFVHEVRVITELWWDSIGYLEVSLVHYLWRQFT